MEGVEEVIEESHSALFAGIVTGIVVFLLVDGLLLYFWFLVPALKKKLPGLIKPKQIKKSKQEELELKFSDHAAKSESCSWLNILLTRIWFEYTEKESIQKFLLAKVEEELVDVKRTIPGIFLKSWEVNDAWVGRSPPSFSNISVVSKQTSDSSFTLLLDILVKDLAFVFTVSTPLDITISVKVSISSLKGRMAFMYSPAHNHTVSFCFVEMPKIEMEVEAAVLNNKSNFVSRVLPKLIVFAVHTVIRTKLTLPFMKTKWLINKPEQPPYPWQVDDQQKLYDWKPKKDGETTPVTPMPSTASTSSSISPMVTAPTSQSPPADSLPLTASHTAPATVFSATQRGESPQGQPSVQAEKKGGIYARRHTSSDIEDKLKNKDGGKDSKDSKDPRKTTSLGKAVIVRKENHNWEVWNFTTPTNCGICRQPLWGAARQGSRCADCHFNVHEKCRSQTVVCPVTSVLSNVVNSRQFSNSSSEVESLLSQPVAQPKDDPLHPPERNTRAGLQPIPQEEESDDDDFADAQQNQAG